MSQTRGPDDAPASAAASREGVNASLSRSLFGHAATHWSSFQRFDSLSLATATT
jgi:hypothetical protein